MEKEKEIPQEPQEDTETLQITLTKEEKDILFNIWQIQSFMRSAKLIADYHQDAVEDIEPLMTVSLEKLEKMIRVFEEKGIF